VLVQSLWTGFHLFDWLISAAPRFHHGLLLALSLFFSFPVGLKSTWHKFIIVPALSTKFDEENPFFNLLLKFYRHWNFPR
jgi:hypothetical protein